MPWIQIFQPSHEAFGLEKETEKEGANGAKNFDRAVSMRLLRVCVVNLTFSRPCSLPSI